MEMGPVITDPVVVDGLTTRRQDHVQLRDISMRVGPGEAVGLLGAPGAGKSLLLAHILGLRESRRGQVQVFGHQPRSTHARLQVGCAPQHSVLPRFLYVHEVFDFVGRHFTDPIPTSDLADRFDLTRHLSRPVSALSPGEERQITVALAFIGRPSLVVLDEPTASLDRDARARIRSIIRSAHAQSTALLVATSEPAEAAFLADRVLLMRDGELRFEGDRNQVLNHVGISRVSFRTDTPTRLAELDSAVLTRTQDTGHGPVEDMVSVATNDVDGLLAELAGRHISATDISVRSVSLTEVESLLADRTPA